MEQDQFPSFIQEYLNYLSFKGRKESTIKRYIYDLCDFAEWLKTSRRSTNQLDWKCITKNELEQFFLELSEHRNYNVRTIRRIHSVLKQVATFQFSKGGNSLQSITQIDPPELIPSPLSSSEWVTYKEKERLIRIMSSTQSLSDQQIETFPFYKERNMLIVHLFVDYGLTLRECQQLTMHDIKFERNELQIREEEGEDRIIKLSDEHKRLAYSYFKRIPEPVRPRYYSNDPFIIAFDFKRKTYHWSYDADAPKRMSMIAIQKMLRLEVKRAGLRKGISAQTLRNTFILTTLIKGMKTEELILHIGYTSPLSMNRYTSTILTLSDEQKSQLQSKTPKR